MAPMSLSIWGGPGLLMEGFDQPPMAMMGHTGRPIGVVEAGAI